MIARWTAVGRANPNLRHVDARGGHMPKSAKVVVREFVVGFIRVDDDDDEIFDLGPLLLVLSSTLPSSLISAMGAACLRFLEPFWKRLDMLVVY